MLKRACLHVSLALLSLAHTGSSSAAQSQPTPGVVFDTDMFLDIDDGVALSMVHALADRGEIRLLGVTISSDEKWIAPYIDAVNTFYGRPGVPIGIVTNGVKQSSFKDEGERKFLASVAPGGVHYSQHVVKMKKDDGSSVYPRSTRADTDVENSVSLLRRILAGQPDQSVVLIQVGFSTNFARLLESRPDHLSSMSGQELIRQKVRLLSVMAGYFGPKKLESPEFNIKFDVPSARKIFSRWPTPIIVNGTEVGGSMTYGGSAIDLEFRYTEHHPIPDLYRYVSPRFQAAFPSWRDTQSEFHKHHTADLPSVLYAARPDSRYYSLSKPGRVTVDEKGLTHFEERAGGLHRYLVQSDEQRNRTLEIMSALISQPSTKHHPSN